MGKRQCELEGCAKRAVSGGTPHRLRPNPPGLFDDANPLTKPHGRDAVCLRRIGFELVELTHRLVRLPEHHRGQQVRRGCDEQRVLQPA
jgi:hypothetical protein